jgi:preprotein translocase subunit YajC
MTDGTSGSVAKPAPETAASAPQTAGSERTGDDSTTEYTGQSSKGAPGVPESPSGARRNQPNNHMFIFLMIGVAVLFYFMIMRPQKKREQQRRDMLGKLKTGDKIITASGIVGEIVELSEQDALVRIDPRKDVRMRVRRAAIAGPAGDAGSEETVAGAGQ